MLNETPHPENTPPSDPAYRNGNSSSPAKVGGNQLLIERLRAAMAECPTAKRAAEKLGITAGYASKLNAIDALISPEDRERLYRNELGVIAAYHIVCDKPATSSTAHLNKRPSKTVGMVLSPGLRLVLAADAAVPIDAAQAALKRVLDDLNRFRQRGLTKLDRRNFGNDSSPLAGGTS